MQDFKIEFMTPQEISKPLPIAIGLASGSGLGKTYSALKLAAGMADVWSGKKDAPVAFIDTENRRGLHYARTFPQIQHHYIDLAPEVDGKMVGYPPERWIAAMDFVESSGAQALVVDSWSHSWSGINGLLEQQEAVLQGMGGGEKNKLRSWAKVKPRYRRLVNRVIHCGIPVVLCFRAKPTIVDLKTGKNSMPTKTRRDDVPWDWEGDKDLAFEMAAMVVLDGSPGTPKYHIKVADQFKTLFRQDRPLTYETGVKMAEWSKGSGDGEKTKAVLDAARAAARNGAKALKTWYSKASEIDKMTSATIAEELRRTASEADEAPKRQTDMPGDPPEPRQGGASDLFEGGGTPGEAKGRSAGDTAPLTEEAKRIVADARAGAPVWEVHGVAIERIKKDDPDQFRALSFAISEVENAR